MLRVLELKDFAIVDELRLELSPGLNALTGETGAGKSILVDALELLAGARADSGQIRAGCTWALVQGVFEGAPVESASRRLQVEGRSSARLDGELVTVAELAQRIGELVAIHGQHASQALASRDEPRRRLDRLLGEDDRATLASYRDHYEEYRKARATLEELRQNARERERLQGTLQFEIDEIDGARLQPEQDSLLADRAQRLRNAERIIQGAAQALGALSEGERSAAALLAAAARELQAAGRFHPALAALAGEVEEARAAVQATGAEVESFLADFEAQPGELDLVESRLAKIAALERKYGEGLEAVLAYRNEAAARLERLEEAAHDIEALEKRLSQLAYDLERSGELLSRARDAAARELEGKVTSLLTQLGMPGARFQAALERHHDPAPFGFERVTFSFGANPGEPLGDLSDVASGGELSRVMLALDVVTGSDRPVLVFDEVDAGVGGKAARAVGAMLKRLAAQQQVLVVTHLPQVAAFADAQFFVEKRTKEGRTVTRVHRLEPHEREQELARMLSGNVTEASLENARELVNDSELR